MKRIEFDESKMSISSDDMNPVMHTTEKTKSRCTKKCLFGIIILGCLILSILIALDVISLKKILHPGSDTKNQNKQNLQVQNQITQENKPESSNQQTEEKDENKKVKKEEKNEEDKDEDKKDEDKKDEDKKDDEGKKDEDKKDEDKNDEDQEDKKDKKEEDKNDEDNNDNDKNDEDKKDEDKNDEDQEDKKDKKEENKNDEDKNDEDKKDEDKNDEDKNDEDQEDKKDKKEGGKNDEDKNDEDRKDEDKKDEDKNDEDKNDDDKNDDDKNDDDKNDDDKNDDDKNDDDKNDADQKDEDKNDEDKNDEDKNDEDKKDEDKKEEEDDSKKTKKKKSKKKKKDEDEADEDKKEKEKAADDTNDDKDDDKDKEDWKKDYDKNPEKEKDTNDTTRQGNLEDDNKELNDTYNIDNLDDIDDKALDDFDGLGSLDDNYDDDKELNDFDGLGNLDDVDDSELDDFDGLGNLDDIYDDDSELDDFDGLGNLDDDSQLDDFDGLGDLDNDYGKELNDFDGLGNLDDDDSELNDFDGLGDIDQVKKDETQESEKVIKKNLESSNGNVGLNPNYKAINPDDEEYAYVPIVGIDDVHGLFFPKINKVKIDNDTLEYKTGGLEYVTKYLNILRKDFGSSRVLYFDGGDFYQGGIDSVLFDGEIMVDFYNLIGINGTTIGNHEFDYSREWIENKIKTGNYTWLINNIKDNSTNKIKGALGKKHARSKLYKVKLPNNDTIKIGVIGLSYNMKNDKTMPNTWGNRNTWDNISFYPYIQKLEKESKALRKKGAVAVLALAHFGLVCNQTLAMKLDMYNKSSVQGKCLREDDDSVMFKLTDKLKPGIIDGIIGGDTHMEMHHWENGIPLMSTPTHARYINIMYLPFKKNESGDYYLVNDEIKIEGPLPACEKIFENYQNCELISAKEYIEAGKLINYTWRGEQIETDKSVQTIYDKYYEKFKDFAEQDIVSFEGFDKIKVDKSGDCTLCNTYLDAIVDIKKADFAIINRGIFPEELVPGTLTRAEFYNQMPYLDKICTVEVTGRELKDIVETVQSVGKSFYPSSNLKQTIKIDENGVKNVTKVELYVNGTLTQIDENQTYKMASSLFVLSETSGEDFAKGKSYEVIHAKAMDKKVTCSNVTIDNEMSDYFKGKGVIDLSKKVDQEKPRIFIEK